MLDTALWFSIYTWLSWYECKLCLFPILDCSAHTLCMTSSGVASSPRQQLSHFTATSPQNLQWCYLTLSTVTCRTNDESLSTKSGTPPPQYASDLHLRFLEGHLPALNVSDEALTFLLQQVRAAWEPASMLHPRVIPRLPVVQRSVTAKTSHAIAMTCTQGKEKIHLSMKCMRLGLIWERVL